MQVYVSPAQIRRYATLVALVCSVACTLVIAPAFADPAPKPVAVDDATTLEKKLDTNARVGSEEEQRLKAQRAAERARLIELRKRERRNEVIIIGSSSVKGALGRRLSAGLERSGFKATRWGRSASGLSRLDYYDWFDAITDLPIGDKTAGVIVYVGVNDPQGIWLYPHERKTRDKWIRFHQSGWHDKYRERVTMLINALCALGAPHVAILTPADVRWESLQKRLVRVRRLQIEGARASKCGVAVSASGDSMHIADPIERKEPRRARDGYHLTALGGDIVWERVKYRVTRLFSGQPWLQTQGPGSKIATAKKAKRSAARAPAPSGRHRSTAGLAGARTAAAPR